MKLSICSLIASIFCIFPLSVTASLIPAAEFDGQIIQQDINYYWLADANLAITEQFGVGDIDAFSGTMTRDKATEYIAAMNTARYLGQNDWRLPTIWELELLWSNELGFNVFSGHENLGLFSNIGGRYFTSTTTSAGATTVWIYDTVSGTRDYQTSREMVWAVRTGDLSPIPIPGAIWLFGSGLIGLVCAARGPGRTLARRMR